MKTAPATETSAMSVIREGFYRIGDTDARPVVVSELQTILRSVRRSVNCAFWYASKWAWNFGVFMGL